VKFLSNPGVLWRRLTRLSEPIKLEMYLDQTRNSLAYTKDGNALKRITLLKSHKSSVEPGWDMAFVRVRDKPVVLSGKGPFSTSADVFPRDTESSLNLCRFLSNLPILTKYPIVQRILMLDGYHSKMSFMRVIPSLKLINCSIMLRLVFHPPQNASLAFMDIGEAT
jgi:hypothetical protein